MQKNMKKDNDENRYGKIIYESWLFKRSKGKKWTKRYGVLWEDYALRLYETKERGSVIGKIKVKKIDSVKALDSQEDMNNLMGAAHDDLDDTANDDPFGVASDGTNSNTNASNPNYFCFAIWSQTLQKTWPFGCEEKQIQQDWIKELTSTISVRNQEIAKAREQHNQNNQNHTNNNLNSNGLPSSGTHLRQSSSDMDNRRHMRNHSNLGGIDENEVNKDPFIAMDLMGGMSSEGNNSNFDTGGPGAGPSGTGAPRMHRKQDSTDFLTRRPGRGHHRQMSSTGGYSNYSFDDMDLEEKSVLSMTETEHTRQSSIGTLSGLSFIKHGGASSFDENGEPLGPMGGMGGMGGMGPISGLGDIENNLLEYDLLFGSGGGTSHGMGAAGPGSKDDDVIEMHRRLERRASRDISRRKEMGLGHSRNDSQVMFDNYRNNLLNDNKARTSEPDDETDNEHDGENGHEGSVIRKNADDRDSVEELDESGDNINNMDHTAGHMDKQRDSESIETDEEMDRRGGSSSSKRRRKGSNRRERRRKGSDKNGKNNNKNKKEQSGYSNVLKKLDDEKELVMFEGYLERKTNQRVFGKRLWETRYFKLKTHSLSVFVDKNALYPESTWKISSIKTVRVVARKEKGARFELVCKKADVPDNNSNDLNDSELIELRATSPTNCEEWVSHISEEKKRHRTTLRYGLQNIALEKHKQKETQRRESLIQNNNNNNSSNNTNENNNNKDEQKDTASTTTNKTDDKDDNQSVVSVRTASSVSPGPPHHDRRAQFANSKRMQSKRFKLNSRSNRRLVESPVSADRGMSGGSLEQWALEMQQDIDAMNSRRTESILSGNVFQTHYDMDTIRKERLAAEELSVSTTDHLPDRMRSNTANSLTAGAAGAAGSHGSHGSHGNMKKKASKPKLFAPVQCEGYLIRRVGSSLDLSPKQATSQKNAKNATHEDGVNNMYYFELCDDTLEWRKHKLKSNLNNKLQMNSVLGSVSVDYIKNVRVSEEKKKEIIIEFNNNDMFDEDNRWYLEVPNISDDGPDSVNMNNLSNLSKDGAGGGGMAAMDSLGQRDGMDENLEKIAKNWVKALQKAKKEAIAVRDTILNEFKLTRSKSIEQDEENEQDSQNGAEDPNDAKKKAHQVQQSNEFQTIQALADCIQDSTIAELAIAEQSNKKKNLGSFNLNIENDGDNGAIKVQVKKHVGRGSSNISDVDPNRHQQSSWSFLCCCKR